MIAAADKVIARLCESPSLLVDADADFDQWYGATASSDRGRAQNLRNAAREGRTAAEAEGVTPKQLAEMQVGRPWDQYVAVELAPRPDALMVVPQRAPIPADAVYRLWDPAGGHWMTFVEDAANRLYSAPGTPGYCPAPGDAAYLPGLVPGNLCVQVVVEDGGPNDADGERNGSIATLGGVARKVTSVVTGSSVGGKSGGGAMGIECLILALLAMWRALLADGVYTNIVLPPACRPDACVLRTSYSAAHSSDHIDRALAAFERAGRALRVVNAAA